MTVNRRHWLRHVNDIVRSRHYTWLPQGLGGENVDVAMTYLLTDIMHVCKLTDVSFDHLLSDARHKFRAEEAAEYPTGDATPPAPPAIDGEKVISIFETNDVYEAEIIRARLENEGIACRVDSQSQGGFTELVETKLLVHTRDSERATKLVGPRQ